MDIVGIEVSEGVHTIEMWFSVRRQCWFVERRNLDGAVVGFCYSSPCEFSAEACLLEWLRDNPEVHLIGRTPRPAIHGVMDSPRRAA